MLGLSLFLAGLSLLSPSGAMLERHVGAMGTTFSLRIDAATRAEALAAAEAAVLAVEATEARLSTWNEASELSALNRAARGETVPLSFETAQELAAALHCRASTGGAFDPAMGPVLEVWGVRDGGRLPSETDIEGALRRQRSSRLRLDESGGAAWQGATGRIEEGGFGKGAGLDRAAASLSRVAPRARAWMSLGGQIQLVGVGQGWEVPIADPRERRRVALTLRLPSGSISTSGNSEQAIEIGGKRYGHVFDPRSGRPAADFGSLTVVSKNGLLADCLSTGLYVLGPDAAFAWAVQHPEIELLSLEPRGERVRARLTPGLEGALVATGENVDVEIVAGRRPQR